MIIVVRRHDQTSRSAASPRAVAGPRKVAVRLTRWLAALTIAPPGALALVQGIRGGVISPWLYAMTSLMLAAPLLFVAMRHAPIRAQALTISLLVTAISWLGLLHFGPTLPIGMAMTTSGVCWTLFFGRGGLIGGVSASLIFVAFVGWADTLGALDFVFAGPRDALVWLRIWVAVAGNLVFVCGVTHVTWNRYRQLLRAEGAARTEAEHAMRARDEFLSLASHELRTPLTSLKLIVQSMAAGLRHDERVVESMDRQVRRLERLVAMLIDVTSLDAGRALVRETFDLAPVTREVTEELGAVVRADSTLSLHATEAVRGHWDRALVEQLVAQVVSNAIKFGAGRPIDVTVEGTDRDARVIVRDRGKGISAADREQIFERFHRGVSWTHHGGLGLGLYLALRIARMHGGDLLHSDTGDGTTFTIVLPRGAAPAASRAATAGEAGTNVAASSIGGASLASGN